MLWTSRAKEANMNKISQYYKKIYSETSSFQNLFDSEFINYNSREDKHWNFIFKDELKKFLFSNEISSKDVNLENLHNEIGQEYFSFNTIGQQNNSRPKISDIGFDFILQKESLYHDFLRWVRKKIIKKNFYFQKTPTIRFHVPGIEKRLSLPAWHSDSFFGHSPKEINFWFGLTDNKHSDFWMNSLQDSEKWFQEYSYDREAWKNICFSNDSDFIKKGFINAFEVCDIYDNLAIFDSRCIHTVDYRSERDPTTKITIDMRIILVDDYEWLLVEERPIFVGDGIKKAEFRPGSKYGYHKKSIDEIMFDK